MDCISQNFTDHSYGIMIKELCFYRDSCDALKLFNSLNTYVRYKNIYSNVYLISFHFIMYCIALIVRHLSYLYLFCFVNVITKLCLSALYVPCICNYLCE